MAEENLQYTVTFKTKAEGTGAKDTLQAVKDLKGEQEKLNRLRNPEQTRQSYAAEYDLSRAIEQAEKVTKKATTATNEDNFVKVRARQAAQSLVEEMKREELAQRKLEAAKTGATKASRTAASAIQNTSFQVQDLATQLAAGTSAATAFGQQLPQLLGGFGMWGALAGGVVALGALVLKMGDAKEETEDFKKAAEDLKEALDALRETKAQEYAEAFARSIELTRGYMDDLAEAELRRVSTAAKVAEANNRIKDSQDAATAAALDYMETVLGLDVTELRRAKAAQWNEAKASQDREKATQELREQEGAYDAINRKIAEQKQQLDELERQRQEASRNESALSKSLKLAEGSGKQGAAGDLQMQLENVKAKAAEIDRLISDTTTSVDNLTRQAFAKAMEIDSVREVTEANLSAINAELESAKQRMSMSNAMESNKQLTGELTAALETFQTLTPTQEKAAQAIRDALADGQISANETAKVGTSLQTLLGTLTQQQTGHSDLLNRLLGLMQTFDRNLKDANKKVDGLINGIK